MAALVLTLKHKIYRADGVIELQFFTRDELRYTDGIRQFHCDMGCPAAAGAYLLELARGLPPATFRQSVIEHGITLDLADALIQYYLQHDDPDYPYIDD